MKETTRATYPCAYSPVPEKGTGKLKLNGNLYGTGRSVHCPFNSRSIPVLRPFFFKRAPVVRIERGNFFLTPTVCMLIVLTRISTVLYCNVNGLLVKTFKYPCQCKAVFCFDCHKVWASSFAIFAEVSVMTCTFFNRHCCVVSITYIITLMVIAAVFCQSTVKVHSNSDTREVDIYLGSPFICAPSYMHKHHETE